LGKREIEKKYSLKLNENPLKSSEKEKTSSKSDKETINNTENNQNKK